MPRGDVETYHEGDQWVNRVTGGGEVGTFDTKAAAVESGRDLARRCGVEHIIKKMDGTIGERNSYGHDPSDIPG